MRDQFFHSMTIMKQINLTDDKNLKEAMKGNHMDVIVIGGGHAGIEAALAAARTGANTLLITNRLDTIGQMSCNPAIGGIGKGHIVKEIDALGGLMARAIDQAGIQFRILNASKGPAVRATRAQADRVLYRRAVQRIVSEQQNLSILEGSVEELIFNKDSISGVRIAGGQEINSTTVVLTTGTFLDGRIHVGLSSKSGGRVGDPSSRRLAENMRALSFRRGRLKTGTPPRIDGSTINYSELVEQKGDEPLPVFSFMGDSSEHPRQISCHITETNENTHEIIQKNLNLSPIYSGLIEGPGPRYCPSIEDKVVRFSERAGHQIFLEPEGLNTQTVYPNGISTSLPAEIQEEFVRTIKGLEEAKIEQLGYAIEYDFFDPRDLLLSLETRTVKGLFFAGQINGTTGYEEAAGQGLIAGLNAGRIARDLEPWTPRRDEAYIGVMIDDLVTRGVTEPYRMFTSRAEYRLKLREDNADLRLTETGRALGLINEARWARFCKKNDLLSRELARLNKTWVLPDTEAASCIEAVIGQKLKTAKSLSDLLRRPELSYGHISEIPKLGAACLDAEVTAQIEINLCYEGYINRQQKEINRQKRFENMSIPKTTNFADIRGLSAESVQILGEHKPETLGQASRISGITPATISLLLVHLKNRYSQQKVVA